MLPKVSVRNRKIYKTPVRSQLEQGTISGYGVQQRLSETGIVQEKVSTMTSLMRQKDTGFTTGAKGRLLWRGKGKIKQYEPAIESFRLELERRLIATKIILFKQSLPKEKSGRRLIVQRTEIYSMVA